MTTQQTLYFRCLRKHAYPNYAQAKEVLQRMLTQELDFTLDIYRCPHGDHLHIGHASGGRARKLAKRRHRLWFA